MDCKPEEVERPPDTGGGVMAMFTEEELRLWDHPEQNEAATAMYPATVQVACRARRKNRPHPRRSVWWRDRTGRNGKR